MRPDGAPPVGIPRHLLWIDSGAAWIAGLTVLALHSWLSAWYALPRDLILAMGAANLTYGAYSGLLARRTRRPYGLLVALVAANATWAVLCGVLAVRVAGTATVFGLAHLVGEMLFVGGLAWLEWRLRARLLVAG